MRHFVISIILLMASISVKGQEFTLADTLRGTLSDIRSCYDVTYYDLQIDLHVETKTLTGVNNIYFTNTADFNLLQVDLFKNMRIDKILYDGQNLTFERKYDAVFVSFPENMKKGVSGMISVHYAGTPIEATNAPWDGGFVWKEDSNGKTWVGVACEGTGASLWWPNKDHLSDEPDSMRISCITPKDLMCVANGDLESSVNLGNRTVWNWKVNYPINNYNVTLNVADYGHFSNIYKNKSGEELRCDYYVLKENLEKAKEHFKQVPEMMDCFEEAFGPYPFYRDGYALVETPYLGMEHQSAIAYGNKFMPGYLGRHPSDMDFDFIIIHETGHEWWGNSVSMKDVADMWIHESFCTYSESVFVECKYGYEKMLEYLMYQRNFINNRSPILGKYGLNHEGNAGDMYFKGSWVIHTLRNVLDNDSLFKSIIKGIAEDFAYQTVDGDDIINFISTKTSRDFGPFFEQYLGYSDVPVLEYRWSKKNLELRWVTNVPRFSMPVVLKAPKLGEKRVLVSNLDWNSIQVSKKDIKSLKFRDDLFLMSTKKLATK
jgi:aminopeptidase N